MTTLTQRMRAHSSLTALGGFAVAAILLFAVAPAVLSDFRLNLLAKFLCFAIVAVGIGLAWGRGGMLTLGQGVFFGLGAYIMAMHLQMADATRLGAIDSERATLSSATDGPIVTPAEARSARLVWMKQVRALLAVADAINLSDAAHQSIFGNLEAAIATASKRGRTPKQVVTTAVATPDPLKAV